ncbi:hypothetical protein LPB86_16830 [Pedobacter sp. MC2016-14]|uniref:hypothetical protein n=1 Tax=Pedobacter sp. MC2016-14 TaxID=2897327 RepID=UPI001E299021|nr:hypothetical protein [Pedobacter sp. MC2016-14]MCD0489909.1 hypothetical protein [Pedobacter sp. MC2016-14]
MNKLSLLFITAIAVFITGCSSRQAPKFGKDLLHLDDFGLNIDVETFFGDETLFRSNDDYMLKAEESAIRIGDTDSVLKYVRYSVIASPGADTLARYKDFYFGELEVVMDFDDKETFMVAVSEENFSPGKVDSLIQQISEEYGSLLPHPTGDEPRYVTYSWKKGDQLARLVLNVDNPGQYSNDNEPKPDAYKLFSDAYHKEQAITVNLFITKPKFDHYLKEASSISGLMTRYR